MGRGSSRLVREVEGRGLEHDADGSGTLGYGGVDKDDSVVGVKFLPNGFEGRFAEVFAIVGGEEADAVGFQIVQRVPDFGDAAVGVVETGDGGEEAEM